MTWELPPVGQVWRAIDLYLARCYAGSPPAAARSRLEALKLAAPGDFYGTSAVERDSAVEPHKYGIRLGNRFYPHMKLVIERSPDARHALFRADTHDHHVKLKLDGPEAAALADLMKKNQELAQQVEHDWDEAGIPTFRRYLRDDLARRMATQQRE